MFTALLDSKEEININQCVLSYEDNDVVFLALTLPLDLDYNRLHTTLLNMTKESPIVLRKNGVDIESYTGYSFSTLTLNHEEDNRVEMVCSFRRDYAAIMYGDLETTTIE